MDKYLLALLGEAGATGLAKGIYIVRKNEKFFVAYKNELEHLNYFRKYRRSFLEKPVYVLLLIFGVLVGLLGAKVIKLVVNYVETRAIEFYRKNFEDNEDIKKIIEDEMHHFIK